MRGLWPLPVLAALTLCGCAPGPEYVRPSVTVPGGYPGREDDKIPTATLESLINRLNLALNLIIDKALD